MSRTTARPRIAAIALLIPALAACGAGSDANDRDSPSSDEHLIGHVHGLGINPADDALYVAAHFGVFRIEDGTPTRIADRWQDTMGFTVSGPDTFLASGHPDLNEELPPHLGLIESTDGAETWNHLSLQGEADFHALEISGDRIYGYDSTSGQMMTTTDGESWRTLATGQYVDLASLPSQPDRVLATTPAGEVHEVALDGTIRELSGAPKLVLADTTAKGQLVGITAAGEIYRTNEPSDGWRTAGRVAGAPAALEATDDAGWYVATGDAIYTSSDSGATWTEIIEALE